MLLQAPRESVWTEFNFKIANKSFKANVTNSEKKLENRFNLSCLTFRYLKRFNCSNKPIKLGFLIEFLTSSKSFSQRAQFFRNQSSLKAIIKLFYKVWNWNCCYIIILSWGLNFKFSVKHFWSHSQRCNSLKVLRSHLENNHAELFRNHKKKLKYSKLLHHTAFKKNRT